METQEILAETPIFHYLFFFSNPRAFHEKPVFLENETLFMPKRLVRDSSENAVERYQIQRGLHQCFVPQVVSAPAPDVAAPEDTNILLVRPSARGSCFMDEVVWFAAFLPKQSTACCWPSKMH